MPPDEREEGDERRAREGADDELEPTVPIPSEGDEEELDATLPVGAGAGAEEELSPTVPVPPESGGSAEDADDDELTPTRTFQGQAAAATEPGADGEGSRVIAGRYLVVDRLGGGSFGEVFRVRDTQVMERDYALKVLRPEYTVDDRQRQLFLREIQVMMDLLHEHIVPVRGYGETDDGHLYLTMDLVGGESLRGLLRREEAGLGLERALELDRQLLEALAVAHGKGIVHRDLKPENLLIEDGRDFLRVTDFGIARIVDEALGDSEDGDELSIGRGMGTPHYMAPEQWQGLAVDARADLYASGVILYELLSRQRPFRGKTTRALFREHLSTPPPSFRKLAEPIEVPETVERAVMRRLAKEPDERPATAEEALAEMRDAVEAARNRSRAAEFLRKHPLPRGLAELVRRARLKKVTPGAALLFLAMGVLLWRSFFGEERALWVPLSAALEIEGQEIGGERSIAVRKQRVQLAGLLSGLGQAEGERVEIEVRREGSDEVVARLVPDGEGAVAAQIELPPGDSTLVLDASERIEGLPRNVVVRRVQPLPELDVPAEGRRLSTAPTTILTRVGTLELDAVVPSSADFDPPVDHMWLLSETDPEAEPRRIPVPSERFRFELDLLDDRAYRYRWAYDEPRFVVPRSEFVIVRDTLVPELTLVEPREGARARGAEIAVSGEAIDEHLPLGQGSGGVVVRLRWRGAETAAETTTNLDSSGKFSTTLPLDADRSEGEVEITVEVTDLAGNVGSANRAATVDRVPPALVAGSFESSIVDGPDGPLVAIRGAADEPLSAATAAVGDAEPRELRVEGARFELGNVLLAEGRTSVELVLVDLAGNRASSSRTLRLDTTPPEVARASVAEGPGGSAVLAVRASEPVSSAAVTVAGRTFEVAAVEDASDFEVALGGLSRSALAAAENGPTNHPIEIRLVDHEGHETAAALVVHPGDPSRALERDADGLFRDASSGDAYCPKDPRWHADRHGPVAAGAPLGEGTVDRWVLGGKFCTLCGWPRPNSRR